jgi:phage tail sheath gpL-like
MSAVDISAVSRVMGVEITYKDFNAGKARFLPQRIAVIGQGATAKNGTYPLTPNADLTAAGSAAELYGYGSPLHLAARQLFPRNGNGIGSIPVTFYPMNDDESGEAAAGAIGATGTQTTSETFKIKVNEIDCGYVTVPEESTADDALSLIKAAIDAVLDVPITSGSVSTGSLPVMAKWKGESGNDIYIEITSKGDSGITYSITQPAGGAANPDVNTPLANIQNTWETLVVNCLNYTDDTTLDKYKLWGKGRWNSLSKKPVLVITGTKDNYTTVRSITNADVRKDDHINFILPAPGSKELPFVIAARAMVDDIAKTANNNPPCGYCGQLEGLVPGPDGAQFDYAVLDATVKKGCSTTIITNGEITLNDVVTCYHPDGSALPEYRYVCDIVKLMNVVYNVRLLFENDEWRGAPLLPDTTPTRNPRAKKPKDAKTALINLAKSLAEYAILAEWEYTAENLEVSIDATNPKRMNFTFPFKLSGNVEIIDGEILFGFYFGS